MADHGHSHGPNGSCSTDRHEEDQLIQPEALQANLIGINYVRSLMAIVSGCVAGIAGLTGSKGFFLYLFVPYIFFVFYIHKKTKRLPKDNNTKKNSSKTNNKRTLNKK